MKTSTAVIILLGSILLFQTPALRAQEGADDVEVWSVIERQWELTEKGDDSWVTDLLSSNFIGWNKSSPAPRSKGSVRMWQKFEAKQWDGKVHELYPLSIVVHGDTAIAHYLYSNAGENSDGKTITLHGRFTDVLVKEDGEWRFIAWHGGADDE